MKTIEDRAKECYPANSWNGQFNLDQEQKQQAFINGAKEAKLHELKFKSVEFSLPAIGVDVLWRAETTWRTKDKIQFFNDKLTSGEESLEYGQIAYLLENNSDFLVSQHKNISELCDSYVTHYCEIPTSLI